MANLDEIYDKLEKSADGTVVVSKAYDDVLTSEGEQDIQLWDGRKTPNLNKRLANQVKAVTSVNGKKGDVIISRDELGFPTNEQIQRFEKEDRFVITESGRTQREKNKENIKLSDFYAFSDPILEMQSVCGFIIFPIGETKITKDTTINTPIYFDEGAYLTVDSGVSCYIRNTITSSKQWIFRGEGNYNLGVTGVNNGENAREIHISWFGALGGAEDVTSKIQKACDAVGNNRESVIKFDTSNYVVSGEIAVGRCTEISGAGTRRTVFRVARDTITSDIFTTKTEGVTFKGIQFETQGGLKQQGCWIRSTHDNIKVLDVQAGHANYGIQLLGDNCEVRNARGVYGSALSSDSYLINIASGSNAIVDDVKVDKTSFAPDSVVLVGGESQTRTVATATITNIKTQGKAVKVKPKSGMSIARCNIHDIFGTSTTAQSELVLLETNSGNILEINVNSLACTNQYNKNLGIVLNGGQLTRAVFDKMTSPHNTADTTQVVIGVNNISGSASYLTFMQGCGVTNRPKIIDLGTLSTNTAGLYVAPELDGLNQPLCKVFNIANNAVQVIKPTRQTTLIYATIVYQAGLGSGFSSAMLRAFSSPSTQVITANAKIVYTTDLSQANAQDGFLTVSANANGSITLINKLGSSVNVCLTINC